MKWKHEFYQRNPNDYSGFYYFSQRKARAILESIQEIKRGLYKAKVVSIESDNEFKVMSQCGDVHINIILVRYLHYDSIKTKIVVLLVILQVNFGMTQEYLANLMVKGLN